MPALAVKLADVAPDATVTDAGTFNAPALLESVTLTPPAPAACVNVTVHADVPPGLRLVGSHETWLTASGASREIEAVCELLL